MKAMGTVVCALALAAAACVEGPHYDDTSLALTGSGSGSGSSTNGGSVWHSTWNGRGASLGAWSIGADGYQRSYYVSAWQTGTGANATVTVNFQFQGPDPASYTCSTYDDWYWGSYTYCYYTQFINEYGWGTIPSSDFQVTGNASAAHLHTTTGPGFVVERCTYNWYAWDFECTDSTASETFDLSWNQNHQSTWDSNGTNKQTWGGFTYQSQGRYVSSSADATGTAFGVSVSTSNASIQDSRGTSVGHDVLTAGP